MASSTDRPRRPSITDVARRAGVSVGTVSNVLNRPDQVATSTRDRVVAVIEELGFVRNASARQLRTGPVRTVGAIVVDIADPFVTGVARGVEDRVSPDDYALILSSTDADPQREARSLRLLEEHGVQGVLITPTHPALEHVLAARDRGVHVVLLDALTDRADLTSVGVDEVRGGGLAIEHLLDLGHRRIALVDGPVTARPCADRRAGVVAALRAAGLDPAAVLTEVVVPAVTTDAGDAAMTQLLGLDPARRPTATFCGSDVLAAGAVRALRRAGVPAPDAMAVVGYDDVPLAAALPVPLTSVRRPAHTLGWTAADLLLRETAAGRGAQHQRVLFQPELVVRASTVGG